MGQIKCITIRQPWAWAIMTCGKRVENRRWGTTYRGPILIHAAVGLTRPEYDEFVQFWEQDFPRRLLQTFAKTPPMEELVRGRVVGRAALVDVVTQSRDPWFFGPKGLVLFNVVPVAPVAIKGQLGLFEVDEAILEAAA